MPAPQSIGRTGLLVCSGVFLALMLDGMDLQMLALSLPSITNELRLDDVSAGALVTYTLIGMAAGGIGSGWLADRIGRARVVWWAVLIFSVLTGLIALCRTYWEIAAMRFLSGIGLGSLYSIGTLLVAEYIPTRTRATVLGILQAGWSIGYIVAALLSSYLLSASGWRILFACAILPGILTLALLWPVPDPPSWTLTAQAATANSLFRAMQQDSSLRRTFYLWAAAAASLQFGYYGANSWLPSYMVRELGINLQNMGWYISGTYAMTALGKILVGYLADTVGRRTIWIVFGVLTALYLPILVYTATQANAPYLLLVFGFLYGAPYAVNATYMSESFPGGIRGAAVATSYNFGRVGSMLSPLMIGWTASRHSIGLGIAMLGVGYAAAALLPGLFIREKMYDPQASNADQSVRTAVHGSIGRTTRPSRIGTQSSG
jgi:AAHS family cis,cis-muconate transporter-like MFS transporter